jgi:hypothetical protein
MDDFAQGPQPPNASFGQNPFGDNPYASPTSAPDAGYGGPGGPIVSRGMVAHVLAVAIMMIVQGVMEILLGLMYAGAGLVVPMLMESELRRNPSGAPPTWFFLALYGAMGLMGLVPGILHLIGGIRGLRYRGRTFGILALCAGMLSVFTCYCAPTSIALGIYGLITYLNPQVAQAFAMGDAGRTRDEIRSAFRV